MAQTTKNVLDQLRGIIEETNGMVNNRFNVLDTKVDTLTEKIDLLDTKMSRISADILDYMAKCEEVRTPEPAPTVVKNPYQGPVPNANIPRKADSSIGTCIFKGKRVKFYGICSECGKPILSPAVISFCDTNNMKHVCYPCQRNKVNSDVITDVKYYDNTKIPVDDSQSTALSSNSNEIILKCEICGKPRRYKNMDDYLTKREKAMSLGLPLVMCTSCAREKARQLAQPKVVPPTKNDTCESVNEEVKEPTNTQQVVGAMPPAKTESAQKPPVFQPFQSARTEGEDQYPF